MCLVVFWLIFGRFVTKKHYFGEFVTSCTQKTTKTTMTNYPFSVLIGAMTCDVFNWSN